MFAKIWKKVDEKEYDFLSFTAILDERGRIIVPAPIRKKLEIKFGSLVFATIEPDHKTYFDGDGKNYLSQSTKSCKSRKGDLR